MNQTNPVSDIQYKYNVLDVVSYPETNFMPDEPNVYVILARYEIDGHPWYSIYWFDYQDGTTFEAEEKELTLISSATWSNNYNPNENKDAAREN